MAPTATIDLHGDLYPLRTMPVLTTTGSLSVARGLHELRPDRVPVYVEKAAARMGEAIEQTEAALAARRDSPVDLRFERAFDLLVDRVWVHLRARLEFWRLYEHEGIALLSEAEQDELGLGEARELAARADDLLAHLFGDGLDFLRMSHPQQAQHMANRLLDIEAEGLGGVFEQLVGAHAVTLVQICQRRYEAMVTARVGWVRGVEINLLELRAKLRRTAESYAALLLTVIDVEPTRGDEILAALHPMLAARARPAHDSGTRPGAANGRGDELDAAG